MSEILQNARNRAGAGVSVPDLLQPLSVDHAFAKTMIRQVVHRWFGLEHEKTEIQPGANRAIVSISGLSSPELLDGYARTLSALTGTAITLRATDIGKESSASASRTVVMLPKHFGLGFSEESPVHPVELRLALARIRNSVVGVDRAEAPTVLAAANDNLLRILDRFHDLHLTLKDQKGAEVTIRNGLTVLGSLSLVRLLAELDLYHANARSELPVRIKLEQQPRDLWRELVELSIERGVVAAEPWRFEVSAEHSRVTAHVESPEDCKRADLATEFERRTGYKLSIRKMNAELHALLDGASHIVRPLDPWVALGREVRSEQVESVASLLPDAFDVARVASHSAGETERRGIGSGVNCVVVEYLRHDLPPAVLRSLVPRLERVGVLVAFVPKTPSVPLQPLERGELEQIVEGSLPSGYFLHKIYSDTKQASVQVLRTNGADGALERWREEFEAFLSPTKLLTSVTQASANLCTRIEPLRAESQRFIARSCDAQGVLIAGTDLFPLLQRVAGVDRHPTMPNRVEAGVRVDLKELFTITIDEDVTRLREDAVSLERLKGGWRLWVHVVDLAAVSPPGSGFEVPARERLVEPESSRGERMPLFHRGYLLDEVSFDRGKVRPALSVRMEISDDGILQNGTLVPTWIKNNVELSYQEAAGTAARPRAAIQSEYPSARAMVQSLQTVMNAVRAQQGLSRLNDQDTYALTGQLLQLSDGVVSEFFHGEQIQGITSSGPNRSTSLVQHDWYGPVSLRRVCREYRSLVNQQQLYSKLFGLPPLADEDLEQIVRDLREYDRDRTGRRSEFDDLHRLVHAGTLIGKKVSGRLKDVGGSVGFQVESAGFHYAARFAEPLKLDRRGGFQFGSLSYGQGATVSGLKVVGVDGIDCQLLLAR